MDGALSIVENWLTITPHRDQFTADEVEDLLLDLRQALTVVPVPA